MYELILKDIREHRIRGSERISKSAILAFYEKKKELDKKCSFISTYLKSLSLIQKELISARENEAMLKNTLLKVFDKKKYEKAETLKEIQIDVENKISKMIEEISTIHEKIKKIGSNKIKNGFEIFTYGHSNLVEEILIESKHKGTSFTVNLSDNMLPLKEYFKGLVKSGLKVVCHPFSGVYDALNNSDIVLIGGNSFDFSGNFQCEFGTKSVIAIAKHKKIPIYMCVDTLKLSQKVPSPKKIGVKNMWPDAPLKINFEAKEYDIINGKDFAGIICERGILSINEFLKQSFKFE